MTDPTVDAGAPPCAPPDFHPREPKLALPAHATDCHAHILGPASRHPYSPARVYTPPDCLLADYRYMLDTIGVERAVLVQPSVYGTDNTVLLEALKGDPRRLRGVVVIPDTITGAELHAMHNAGVRGVRVNIVDVKDRKPGTLPLDALMPLAERIAAFGWHMEFLMHVDEFPDLDHRFAAFPIDIVLGHLGYMRTDKGINAPGFQALLRAVTNGRCWVKLTGPYRISPTGMPHADVTPYARALVAANEESILWGSDWPHVMMKGSMPNDGDLVDLLGEWVPNAAVRQKILVENPGRLYGF